MIADNTHDPLRSNYIVLLRVDHILKRFLGVVRGDLNIVESGISIDLFDGAFQLSNIGFNISSDVLKNLIVHLEVRDFHILTKNSHSCLIAGRLDIRDQSPLETGTEPLIESFHFLGRAVRGKHNLFAGLMELVESMEELFLCGFFSYNKLDIIDQENINCAVLVAQSCHGRGITASDRLDHFICELLGGYIQNPHIGILFQYKVSDRVHKVRLAKSRSSV